MTYRQEAKYAAAVAAEARESEIIFYWSKSRMEQIIFNLYKSRMEQGY